jgi:hypothetical protein
MRHAINREVRWVRGLGLSVAGSLVLLGLTSSASRSVLAADACADTVVCSTGVFCSGFEEGNKSVWDDGDGNPDSTNLLMVDPGPCGSAGNHVMRLRLPPGRGTVDIVKNLPASDRLYARWYMKYEPGYNLNAHIHGSGLFAGNRGLLGHSGDKPTGSDWFTSWIQYDESSSNHPFYAYTYYAGMYQDCPSQGSCFGDSFPCIYDSGGNYCTKAADRPSAAAPVIPTVVNQWYCVEQMMDGRSAAFVQ